MAPMSRTANPLKIQRVQATPDGTHVTNMPTIDSDSGLNLNSDDVEESADRALNGVARKLDKSLSVEYTVNELISTASDIGNLSQIFIGELPRFILYPHLLISPGRAGWSPYF
jgi:ataxia telangiectasia mutated family protein